MTSKFHQENTFQKRSLESSRILKKYPNRIPCIVQSASPDLPELKNRKFLVPEDLTLGQLIFIIRKRMKLHPEKNIYLLINNKAPAQHIFMSEIYNTHKDEDGFIYIFINGDTAFG